MIEFEYIEKAWEYSDLDLDYSYPLNADEEYDVVARMITLEKYEDSFYKRESIKNIASVSSENRLPIRELLRRIRVLSISPSYNMGKPFKPYFKAHAKIVLRRKEFIHNDLAKKLQIGLPTFRKYMAGKRRLSVYDIEQIAENIGVDVSKEAEEMKKIRWMKCI